MNILKVLKSINPFSKNKPKEKTYKDVCLELMRLATLAKRKGKSIPEGLSKEEWSNILSKINFGLNSKIKNEQPKSQVRKDQSELKTKESFKLLGEYIDKI